MSTRRLRVQWILACSLAALLTYSCNRPPEAGEDSSGSTKTPVVVEDSERGVPGWAEPNEGIEAFNRGDYATALGFFQPLAENGDAYAQVVLSKMYELGLGVAKNSGHAVRWDRKAAEQDFAPGQAGLAFSYRAGRGVAKDDGESVRWFRKAAIQGLADAQVHLGARGESVSEGEILEEWACEEEGEVRQWRHGDGHTKTTGTTGRFVDRDGRSAAVWGASIL